MSHTPSISITAILSRYKRKIGVTWLMVVVENLLMALLPLFIGYSIDSLMAGQSHDVLLLAAILLLLVGVSVLRRFYDTRVYGKIRVEVGTQADHQLRQHAITTRNARLTMSRELVDFLEQDLPPLLTAVIQLAVSIVILAKFHPLFAVSAGIASLIMLSVYACFHQHFIRLNAALSTQLERQVNVLTCMPMRGLRTHLEKLKSREIYLSDTEAIVYGLIFLVLFGFVLSNLLLTTKLNAPSAGELFSIVAYSLEYVEAAILLPVTLQTLSRLSEISARLNVR